MIKNTSSLFAFGFCAVLFGASFSVSASAEDTVKKIDDKELNIITKEWKPNQSSEAIQKNQFLKKLVENGVQLIPLGNEEGFDGWLAYKNEEVQVFYTIPGSNAVLTGTMISQNGENLTAFQVLRYENISGNELSKKVEAAAKAIENLPESEKFYRSVEGTLWFGYGATSDKKDVATKALPYLYVFLTPDNKDSQVYFDKLLETYAKKNIIEIRVVPVSTNSKQKELLRKAISQNESAKEVMFALLDGREPEGKNEIAPRSEEFIDTNNKLLSDRKLATYPLTVYKNAKGEVKIIKGLPKNIDDMAADLIIK